MIELCYLELQSPRRLGGSARTCHFVDHQRQKRTWTNPSSESGSPHARRLSDHPDLHNAMHHHHGHATVSAR